MRAIHRAIRIALLGGAIASAAGADPTTAPAPDDFIVREWHRDDGLPSEDVTQLLQDHLGYLWVATRSGLVRFDGTTFVRYSALGREMCIALGEDADGQMLLVPRAGDPLVGRPGALQPAPLPEPYRGRAINAALIAPDGAHWFAIRGALLRIANGTTQVFGPENGISTQASTWLAVDAKAQVWAASDAMLAQYQDGHLAPVAVPGPASELRIGSSVHGGPWVLTSTHVYKVDDAGTLEPFAAIPALLGAHYVTVMREDHNGVLWIGTRSQGVHAILRQRHVHVPTSHDDIFSVVEDREGTLWVGTNSGGLNAISPKIYRLFHKGSGLLENVTTAVCEDIDGAMWFANGDGGIVRLNRGELRQGASRAFGVISVAPNPAGGAWLTGAPGLFSIDPSGNDLRRVQSVPPDGVRRVAYTDRHGDLWLSVDPDGVGRLRAGEFRRYGASDGFTAREVRAFAEDAAGTLWAGTADGKVFRFDGSRFQRLPLGREQLGAINAIAFDETGLLLGTSRLGLVYVAGDRIVPIGSADGLPDTNIAQIVADAAGDFWCGSSRGIFRLRRSDLQRFVRGESRWVTPLLLGKDEGLRTITSLGLYGPGATRSRDGQIWFATRQGVLAITPTAQMLNPEAPRVAIEEVRCDGRSLPLAEVAVIHPGARKVELRFSVLSLSAPSRAQRRYRLDGYDTDWINAGHADTAAYSHLPPGRYRFTVHAGFGAPDADEQSASLALLVEAQWWQTRVFQAGALLALIAAVGAVVRAWSHRRLRARLEKLERESALARERARIAQNIHDDVGASLTRISLLTQTSSPAGGADNLNQIFDTAREITRSLDEIVWAVNPEHDTLDSFITYLSEFAQKFLQLANVRCRFDVPATVPSVSLASEVRHDLFLCCREALNNIVKHAGATEVVLRLTYAAPVLTIMLADNGRGLAPLPKTAADDRVSSGHGLRNLQLRMQQLGGTVSFSVSPGGGTTVALSLALKPSNVPL